APLGCVHSPLDRSRRALQARSTMTRAERPCVDAPPGRHDGPSRGARANWLLNEGQSLNGCLHTLFHTLRGAPGGSRGSRLDHGSSGKVEREKGFEPSTSTLASSSSARAGPEKSAKSRSSSPSHTVVHTVRLSATLARLLGRCAVGSHRVFSGRRTL